MGKTIKRETHDIENIIEKFANIIFKIAYSYTNNKETSEDIMQNVFIKYMTSDYIFHDFEHKKAWIIRVTINECKKSFRRFNYQLNRIINVTSESVEKHNVYYAVMDLPQKYRVVIHLYYYEQLSIKEISEILQKKENTIISLLYRARQKLKKILEVDYEY